MSGTEIDASHNRLRQIVSILLGRKKSALNNPLNEELVLQRFVDRGDDIKKARENINERFDELVRRAERYGKLDMCAVFERLVSIHIRHTVGEIKREVGSRDRRYFSNVDEKFVRDADSFESLDSIIRLIETHDGELHSRLVKIRNLRNEISHGKIDLSLDGLSGEAIKETLNATLRTFSIGQ